MIDPDIRASLYLALQEVGDSLSLVGRFLISGDRTNGIDWGRCAEMFASASKRVREHANAQDYNFRDKDQLDRGEAPPTLGSKINPGRYDCASEALPDEPQFTLLGRDPHAPELIRQWANMREASIQAGTHPPEDSDKILEARSLAEKAERWRTYRMNAWKRGPLQEEIPE